MPSQLGRIRSDGFGESQYLAGVCYSDGNGKPYDIRPQRPNRKQAAAAAARVVGGEAPPSPTLTNLAAGRLPHGVRDSSLDV
jgi:hypothetical protein